jgi:NAD(P)-dependent dehydrogenase (short-subunit alcohol dehydrogenase family)
MPADNLSLAGKFAIITGSGRENGIGAAIALAFARNGASVALNYVSESSAPRAALIVKEIESLGVQATAIQAGIDTPEGAKKLVQGALEAFKTDHIDILGKTCDNHIQ